MRLPFGCLLGVILWGLVLSSSAALAQEQTGTLQGTVIDESGAVLPGVGVTIAGPTIIGGSMTTASGVSGGYRLANVPIGTYKVSFDLPGFSAAAYEGIRIQAGTTITLDRTMAISGVAEMVTVSVVSPIIDTAATAVGFTFTKELMDAVPNARDTWAVVAQAPGITTSQVNVGGTQTGNQVALRGHGVDPRQNTYILNGANVTDNTNNGASQFFFDVDSFDELQVEINSHSAEVQTPGMLLNIVPKSGTNNLNGTASLYSSTGAIQSDNVDDALRAKGVNRASNLNQYLDTGFEVGGPILRDKVWFWGGYRYQEVENFITGTTNPDGTFPIDRTYLWYPSAKVNYKPERNHNFSGYFNMAQKKRFNRNLSALRPIETTQNQQGAPVARLFTLRDDWTARSNLLVSVKVNVMDQGFELRAQDYIDVENTPARQDAATGVWSDAPPNESGIGKDLRSVSGTVNYYVDSFAGGKHDLKFGLDISRFRAFGNQDGSVNLTTYPADHRLIFFNGAPLEVYLFAPGAQSVRNPTRAAFAQDSYRLDRLTLNVGARWDWQANSLAGVTATKSRYFDEGVTQEETGNLITWNTVAPRFGAIYDLTGDSKTLVKASYSRYYYQLWTDKGNSASVAGDRSLRYQWLDLNGDRAFTTNEQGNLLAVDDPASRPVTIDSNLKPTKTDEFVVGLTRELMANTSISASFMARQDSDLDWRINQAISPADYTAVNGVDPGPDGTRGTADDGAALVFYEISAAKRALSPNFITTRQGFEQKFKGFEMTVNRRMSKGWQAVGSITVGAQTEHYGEGSFQNPQDIEKMNDTRIASSTPLVGKLMGSYQFPHRLNLSAFYQFVSGNNYTRTVNSTSALGRSLNQGNVAILAGPRNVDSYDSLNLLDVRLGYDVPFATNRLSLQLDVFNVLNINTITEFQPLSGSAYGRVVNFVPPRIFRFGAKVYF